MITAKSERERYMTSFAGGKHRGFADATVEKGGGELGFRPHELLEAGFACCMNMWVRMYADKHAMSLVGVETRVSINRDKEGEAIFEYAIELKGDLTQEQKREVLKAAESCSVRQTLSRNISFRHMKSLGESGGSDCACV
jgi:putative redox protein